MGDLSALTAAVQQLDADVKALIAATTGTDQADIDAVTAQVQALDSAVQSATPTAPAPAPAPAPADGTGTTVVDGTTS